DIEKLKAAPALNVLQGPELRTIFLGMDQARDELLFSNIKGKNPFKDKRVRQAFYQAIDIEAIKSRIMRGAATPTNLSSAPGIRGFDPALNKRLPHDTAAAKKLMVDAGYPDGFEVGMNCPNDRYVNDAAICQAIAAMLAQIGVKVNLMAETKVTYFPKILSRNTSCYMLGWTPDSYDAQNAIFALLMTPAPNGQGLFNLGSYSNKRVDELGKAIASELDQTKRNAMISELFKIHGEEFGTLPLHQQALAWGVKKNIELVQLADNINKLKWTVVKCRRTEPRLGAAWGPASSRRQPGSHCVKFRQRPGAASAAWTPAFAGVTDGDDHGGERPRIAPCALARQRPRVQFPPFAGRAGVRRSAGGVPGRRDVRSVGGAAQPVRSRDAEPAGRTVAAARHGGSQARLSARHRRPGARRPVGDHVRRANFAAGGPRVGDFRDG